MDTLADKIGYVYIIAVFIISTFLFVTLFIQFWRNEQHIASNQDPFMMQPKIDHKLKLISIASMIFYIFSMISYIIGEIFYDNIYWIGIPYTSVSFNWGLGNFFVYVLFIYRLQDVFKNTAHSLSNNTVSMLLGGMFLFLISQIGVSVSSLLFTLNIGDGTKRFIISDALLFTEDLCDIIVTVALLSLFTKKILGIIVFSGNIYESRCEYNGNGLNAIQINHEQQKLLNVATKMFVLTLCGTMTTQFVTWFAIFAFIHLEYDLGDFYWVHYTLITLSVLDILSNTICIFLSFKFNDYWYIKLCTPLHQCCGLCCLRITKKKIINQYIRRTTMSTIIGIIEFRRNTKSIELTDQNHYHELV